MIGFIKKYLRNKIYGLLLSDTPENKSRFISIYMAELEKLNYSNFRKKYTVDDSFHFNGSGILFYGDGKIVCGKNSYIGHWSMIQSYENCKVTIGQGCSISSNVRIFTQTNISDQDFSKSDRKIKTADVIIGDYVWIGANVVINPGVKIGSNAIIGANSVVTKDIPENTIYGGVPATLLKTKTNL